MNILLERLPTAVEIADKTYELNTDYRVGLNIILAFEDPELTQAEKYAVLLDQLYKEIPSDINQAIMLGVKFLDCGKDKPAECDGNQERLYSFTKDAQYIYTAIRQSHGIDLETVDYLHWWKFCYLFQDLREDCFFIHLIDLRSRRNRGKLTKEEIEYCARISDILDLPVEYTAEENVAREKFLSLLNNNC